MTAADKLLKLECHQLVVGKNIHGEYYVHYEACDVKDGYFLKGGSGTGRTFEEACEDYLHQISGKTLVFHAFDKQRRTEVTVL